jgi:chemotaxis signal transduction protein
MASPPAERKALLFSVGGVRLALRLSQVREILPADPASGEVMARGAALPTLPVAVALGVAPGSCAFAIVTEGAPPSALRVDALHGIVDLARAEVFQLPTRTLLPQPAPFQGVMAVDGEIALELAVPALGWAPIEPAVDAYGPPPELDEPAGRELLFTRRGHTFAVPLALLVQVLEVRGVSPVPLAPPSHLGLAYHGRAIHPVLDPAVVYGDVPAAATGTVLLVDAGGAQVGLAADAILQPGAPVADVVKRPSWDALFAG